MFNSLRKFFERPQLTTYHRRWPRLLMSEPARLSVEGSAPRTAMLEQLCAGGARVLVAERLAPGAHVTVDFKTAAGEQLHQLAALVVHALKEERGFNWRCGLCFVGLEAQETQRLADFVDAERRRREIGFAMPRT